jgi:hypothetical protein
MGHGALVPSANCACDRPVLARILATWGMLSTRPYSPRLSWRSPSRISRPMFRLALAAALRSAGIDVWFDKSELRGGDAWDRQIRKQIHDCALFIPIISSHSQARLEGYFRLERDLAVQRTHLMGRNRSTAS